MEKKIELKSAFLNSILIQIGVAIVIASAVIISTATRELILLSLIGVLVATIIGTIMNLLYFLNTQILEFRTILPGILTVLTDLIIWGDSGSEIFFFLILGITNLGFGLYIYIKHKNKNKSKSLVG